MTVCVGQMRLNKMLKVSGGKGKVWASVEQNRMEVSIMTQNEMGESRLG